MKILFTRYIYIAILIHFATHTFAQCPTCSPDVECISPDGFPAICPQIAASATVGEYYEEVLTFYLPAQITDPGSGIEASLLSVTITSVTGLPYGLVFTLNDADNTYHPFDGDNLGCATICGTPILPGVYNANIAVSAVVNALGFELTQTETFVYTIEVLPGEGNSNSFTYSTPAGCGDVLVTYEASIEFPYPTVVEYTWDFGDGTNGTGQFPSEVLYDAPGTYTASLITTVSEHVLDEINLFAFPNDWNDIEEFFSGPDIYFNLIDGSNNIVFTSATIDNNDTPSWSELSITLTNPPYSIELYDEDDISDDDFISNVDFILSTGTVDINNGAGTIGNGSIILNQTTQIEDSADIIVFNSPDANYTINGNIITVPSDNTNTYAWYLNGSAIPDGNTSSIEMIEGGLYYCEVTTSVGCSSQSSTYIFCPEITPEYDALAMEVSVPAGFNTYQWYFNGVEVDGADTFYLLATQSGNYSVAIQTNYGCSILSEAYILDLSVNDNISQIPIPRVYPSPVENELFISQKIWKSNQPTFRIFDLTGKLILDLTLKNAPLNSIETSSLRGGVYLIEIVDADQTYRTKVVKK